MPASAPPKNALAVCADPNGQVSLTLPPQPHTSRHNHSHVQPLHYPPPPPQSKIAPSGIVGKRAEEPISAEDVVQVAEAVGRERTPAC